MKYSIVIPVYNSQNHLKELYSKLKITLHSISDDYELIFIDDFSRDNSWRTLAAIKNDDPGRIKLIRFSKNFGQHNATMCGLRYSKGELVITLDDDLQHNPKDIPLLINALKEKKVDVIYGIPSNYQHKKFLIKYASRLWKYSSRKIDRSLGEGSSFRIIKREIIEKVTAHTQHFIFIDEILGWYTHIIGIVKIEYGKSNKNKSGYGCLKLLALGLNLIIFYSSLPFKLMLFAGFLMFFSSFFLGLQFLYKKIFIGIPLSGHIVLIVVILFSTSLILICLGIIGQYLRKIFTVLNNKPTYSIKEELL
ncbi:MAG: hypothetical protein A3F13_08770 [Gammaproteobacteria bacterium RIFCSPHIGHO2_12_FULL_40_19]|nr:MAG: hypothetical protein A3F13_08770 [Gammaproteobacteria bacterium RIFCSPHIGHO2_12_FULL_40_19]